MWLVLCHDIERPSLRSRRPTVGCCGTGDSVTGPETVPSNARQKTIASTAPETFDRANGQPLEGSCISVSIRAPLNDQKELFRKIPGRKKLGSERRPLVQDKRDCCKWQLWKQSTIERLSQPAAS